MALTQMGGLQAELLTNHTNTDGLQAAVDRRPLS